MLLMRVCVSGRQNRKRPAVSTSAAAASTLCPLKSSSRPFSREKKAPAGASRNLVSSAR